MSTKRKRDEDTETVKKSAGHWAMGLLMSMKDPELFIKEDDTVVTIKDKYPKVTQMQLYQGLESRLQD
jgi:hypothetical protein